MRTLQCTVSAIQVRRPCLHCEKCNVYKVDDGGSLRHGKLTPLLSERVCLLSAHLPFEIASDILERTTAIKLSGTCIRDAAEAIGEKLFNAETTEKPDFAPAFADTPEMQNAFANRSYLEIDGAMLNTTDGWHENKLGIMFSEADIERRGEGEKERITIKKKTLVSSFAHGVDDFKLRLKLWLVKSRTFFAKEIIAISDGAPWIENLIKEVLPQTIHILDWYHVKEKLWGCAKELFGDQSGDCALWVTGYADQIWNGKIDSVVTDIRSTAEVSKNPTPLLNLYNYLLPRIRMMRYDKFRIAGYYIGSGAIESANRYAIQDRLKKSGMKWSIPGANAIAKLRTLYLSNRWADIWATT